MKRLKELEKIIKKEVPYIDIKPYSHNIISLCLHQISNQYGVGIANRVLLAYSLNKKGWSQSK